MKKCSKELAERLVNMMMTNCSMTQFEHKQYKFDIKFKCSDYDEINHRRDYMFDFVFKQEGSSQLSLFGFKHKDKVFKFYFTLNDLWDIEDIMSEEFISILIVKLDEFWDLTNKTINVPKKSKNKIKV